MLCKYLIELYYNVCNVPNSLKRAITLFKIPVLKIIQKGNGNHVLEEKVGKQEKIL